jgi:hypothetical protein
MYVIKASVQRGGLQPRSSRIVAAGGGDGDQEVSDLQASIYTTAAAEGITREAAGEEGGGRGW